MVPVCSCDVSAVLYACVRCQAFENSLSADRLAGRQELLAGAPRTPSTQAPRTSGATLAIGCNNGDVDLWDTTTKKITGILHGPGKKTGAVASLAFGPDGTLAVGAANGDVYLWHIKN